MKDARHKWSHIVKFHLYETSKIGKSIETESRLGAARGFGEEELESKCLMGMEFLFGVMGNVLELDRGVGYKTLCIY